MNEAHLGSFQQLVGAVLDEVDEVAIIVFRQTGGGTLFVVMSKQDVATNHVEGPGLQVSDEKRGRWGIAVAVEVFVIEPHVVGLTVALNLHDIDTAAVQVLVHRIQMGFTAISHMADEKGFLLVVVLFNRKDLHDSFLPVLSGLLRTLLHFLFLTRPRYQQKKVRQGCAAPQGLPLPVLLEAGRLGWPKKDDSIASKKRSIKARRAPTKEVQLGFPESLAAR